MTVAKSWMTNYIYMVHGKNLKRVDQRYDRIALSLAYSSTRYTLYNREMIASLILEDTKRNNGDFPKENVFIERINAI